MTLSVVDTLLVLLALVLIFTLIYNPLSHPHTEMAWIQAAHHYTEQNLDQNGVNSSVPGLVPRRRCAAPPGQSMQGSCHVTRQALPMRDTQMSL